MSNLKDTDFDDLFRRASDKYPLRTDSSDWDRMAAALEKDPSPNTPDDSDIPDKRRRRRFIFWWFLLLPLAGVGYYIAHNSGHGSGSGLTNGTAKINTPAANTPANPSGNNPGATPTGSNAAGKTGNPGNSAGSATTAHNATSPKAPSTPTTPPTALASTAGHAGGGMPHRTSSELLRHAPPRSVPSLRSGSPRIALFNDPKSKTKTIRSMTERSEVREDVPVRPQTDASAKGANGGTTANGINSAKGTNGSIGANNSPLSLRYADINKQRVRIADAYYVNVDVKAPPKPAPAPSKKDSTKKKSHTIYAGLIAAPDLSTVKLQKATGIGTTFGAVIGYTFNDHWAIETGAYVDRKRYYTDGEYFNTKNVRFPPNYQLLNVDGTCYMWEIPLNVRYTFNPAAKTRWFATAGLSTYLMNRENYTYAYEYNGWSGSSAWNLKKTSQYPFSVVGISAGLEQALGKQWNLRIEPYAKLPLGGIGTGKLPIMSTGINIGITRQLWQKK